MKRCSKCREVKPLDEFHACRSRKDGRQRTCKKCATVRAAERRAADLSAHAEYQRKWRAGNREAVRAIDKRYYDAHAGENWASRYRTRARLYGFDPVVVIFSRDELIQAYGDSCFYCSGAFEEIDHVVAVVNGGEHTLENVRPSCTSCNRKKARLDRRERDRERAGVAA